MKKQILPGLLLGALLFTAPAQQATAQIRNDRGTFTMPGKGDWLVETRAAVDFTGGRLFNLNDGFLANLNNGLDASEVFQGDFSNNNYFPMLKIRKVCGNNWAHRIIGNLSYNSQKVNTNVGDVSNRSFGLALGWGLEKLYYASERLNTYVGGDVTLGYARIGSESRLVDASQNAFGFGFRGFTGMDYYVLPKVYLGLELGYGISFNYFGDVEVNGIDRDISTNDFTMTPFVTPTFRLGYILCGGKKMRKHDREPGYRSRMMEDDE